MAKKREKRKYAEDGVDVEAGDSFSEFAGKLCRETYNNSPYVKVNDFSSGHFRGPRGFRLRGLPPGCWMDMAPDGDGTKVVLTDAAGDYDNAAYGWIAMTCGDITRWGGLPLVVVNNLDAETIGKAGDRTNKAFRTMLASAARIASEQGLVLLKGETAELRGCVTSRNPKARAKYLWSGVAFGAYNPSTIITGDRICEGMLVMALRERGFRNNGVSSTCAALVNHFGEDCYTNPAARRAIKKAAAPAVLYDKFLATLNGWFDEDFRPIVPMYLIVHLTGGAIRSKFADDILFPRGLSAELYDLWDPPEIMLQCAEWRGIAGEECYETWNGGQGVLVVIGSLYEERFLNLAVAHGIEAKRAGEIVKRPRPRVNILSKFSGETITLHPQRKKPK